MGNYTFIKLLLIVCLLFCFGDISAQQNSATISSGNYDQLKKEGKVSGKEPFRIAGNSNIPPLKIDPPDPTTQSALCNCWIERDASWSIVPFTNGTAPEYRNDDGSTNSIPIPFNFCFYGQTVTSVYINNNGNVSIGAPYFTFSANSFPDPSFVMIAPFWGDVDTRDLSSGLVYYKITPTHLIVQWESVGYYAQHTDLMSTFQLIMTDGNDTIIPPGDNVSFCYKDMQWTTGDASQGTGGFGGIPATVGINQGNGVDYIQVGLFDQPGPAWDGPYGNADGIDALDNQSFFFNCCFSSSNIPPIIRSTQVCDTLRLCIGDTVVIDADYLSPEPGEITTAAVNTNGMNGVTILQQSSGNIAHIQIEIIADASNLGYNTIYLIGTDNGVPAQSTSTPIVVNVQPSPTANVSYTPPSPILPGTTVNFTNTSTGMFNHWDFGDGSPTSTTHHPSHTYNNPGTYYVTFVNLNPNGCTDTIILQIDVISCVLVNIITADTVCAGDLMSFVYSGNATGGATYDWDFGDGSTSTIQNPTHSYTLPGSYTVSLAVTDQGCTSIPTTMTVTVNEVPVASFTSSPSICEGDTNMITFTGTALPGANYNWYFQNGTIVSGLGAGPLFVEYQASGTDSIGLIVAQNGCSDTISSSITVSPAPTSDFTVPASVCEGGTLNVNYTGTGSGTATYTWDFGSGTVVSGTGVGPYTVSWGSAGATNISLLVSENGCNSTLTTIPLTVNAIPVASITGTPAICVGDNDIISFNGSAGAGATYTWDFGTATVISGSGSGPYTLTWPADGNYDIGLIVDENGCQDTTDFTVSVVPLPTSAFTLPASVCEGNDVLITYTGNAPGAATYTWNFGGATVISGTGQGPYIVSWNSPGNPSVTLTVSAGSCVSPPSSNSIVINPGPVAGFTATPVLCAGDQNTVTFTGNASAAATWNWDFGSATVISGSGGGPYLLQYDNAGNFNIELIVSEPGCADTAIFAVLVNAMPTTTFGLPPEVCNGDPVTVTYTGTGTDSATCTWTWGGATILSGSGVGPFTVSWNALGPHNVTLSVIENGCTTTPSANTITVNPYPVASVTGTPELCASEENTISFTGTAAPGANFTWDFSGGTIISGSGEGPYVIEWTNAGNQTVSLGILQSGCADATSFDVLVNPIPVLNFATPPAQCFENNLFQYVAGGNLIPGATYSWDFGLSATPSSSTLQNPGSVSYSSPGTYAIILNAVYQNCVADPFIDSAVVFISPVAELASLVQEGCEPLEVPFVNLSSGDNNSYEWNFSDTSSDANESPLHTFVHAGTYSVSLNATTQNGCEDDITYTNVITVFPTPIAGFSPFPAVTTIFEPYIRFENVTRNGDTYTWDFGDSSGVSDQFRPAYEYKDTGTFQVTLYVSNIYGCVDTIMGTVRIEYGYTFYVPNAFTPDENGVNDYFRGFGTSVTSYQMQIFDRWGANVFTTNSYDIPWDGKVDNLPAQNGVYIYLIKVTDSDNQVHKYNGRVSLIR